MQLHSWMLAAAVLATACRDDDTYEPALDEDIAALGSDPTAPALDTPADNAVIHAPLGPPTVTFQWRAPSAGAKALYEVRLSDDADPTWKGPSYVVGRVMWLAAALPAGRADKPTRWSVRGCDADKPTLTGCGGFSSRLVTWSTAPRAPQLLAPSENATVGATTSFRVTSETGATSYLFCIAKPNVACPTTPTDTANVLVLRHTTTERAIDVRRFRGSQARWTGAACNAANRCTYQSTPRALDVQLEAPVLTLPAAGTPVGTKPRFEWQPVPWVEANLSLTGNHYRICFAKIGTPCPSQVTPIGANPDAIVLKTTSKAAGAEGFLEALVNVDLLQFNRSWIEWSVAACDASYCAWQARRSVFVRAVWAVEVAIDSLEVHKDCDSVSAGDWRIMFAASALGVQPSALNFSHDEEELPPESVNGGDVVTSNTVLHLSALDGDTITIGVSAVDCDNDGLWTLLNVFDEWVGLANLVTNWTQTCGLEEPWEWSGDNDEVGDAVVQIPPEQWRGVFRPTFDVTSPGERDCGSNPYTAHYVVSAVRH